MQIPILNGIYTDESADFRTSYPKNLIPVVKETGISKGYLRPGDGVVHLGGLPGVDRGGIRWNDICYRVSGTKFIQVYSDGSYVEIGDVGGTSQVSLDYGPTYLAIVSDNNLFLYNGSTLQQVNDPDLGNVIDVSWVDGYFMTTDGQYLIVGDLNNPFSINPTKYGSSEADPDPIKGILKLRNEIHALNRHTIEVFDNIGGSGFPFQRIEGAQVEKGTIGTHSCCIFMEQVAFIGNGFNEAPSVYLSVSGNTLKIATREIDLILQGYSEEELETVVCEAKVDKNQQHLYIHLPDRTLVYDGVASQYVKEPVWFVLTSSILGNSVYKARNFVWCYDKWIVGDPTRPRMGYFSNLISSQYDEIVGMEFGTSIVYNQSNGAIFHELELVSLPGRVLLGENPVVWTQYSLDGETWSMEKSISAGKIGQRNKRLVWLQQGIMKNYRMQRFRWTSDCYISVARLEVRVEALNE